MKRAMFMTGVLAAALSVTAAGAWAMDKECGPKGKHGPRHMMNFEEVDANQDGKITQDELDAFAKARFDKADTDGDGMLSAEEMQAKATEDMKKRAEKRSAKMLEHKDANGDGKLSFEEMQSKGKKRGGKMIEKMDTDNDGAVSKEEFEAAKAKMEKRHGKKKGACDKAPAEDN
ncbi:EF-hand domain-containing protein [Shimia thalassica]|uniref:EF-hand domain-containing protein n=1 Tax=Shimia thalassica TaxID=1715693 RepID=UPI0027360160|nr:EF-hand domain-containing protein [Shimia thalassica]MDP2579374.1 EF-hand domain-containing protein [Shimia thalassica]